MDDLDIKEERALMEIYSRLKGLEQAFEYLEDTCKKKLSLASGYDLSNPDTYLEIVQPVEERLTHVKNSAYLSRISLKNYRELNSFSLKNKKVESSRGSTKPKKLKTEFEYLEDRVKRLETIVFITAGVLLGVAIGYILV